MLANESGVKDLFISLPLIVSITTPALGNRSRRAEIVTVLAQSILSSRVLFHIDKSKIINYVVKKEIITHKRKAISPLILKLRETSGLNNRTYVVGQNDIANVSNLRLELLIYHNWEVK